MAEYFIKIKDQRNNPIINIDDFYKIELFRSEFGVGSLYIDLPLKRYKDIGFQIDWRIEVYRKTYKAGLMRVGDTQFLIKLVRHKVDEQNKESIHILAYDPLHILKKRIVAYVAGTPYALKENMHADDMLKAIIRENLGELAVDWKRDITQWLAVEEDKSQGAIITVDDFAFQQIAPQLTQICEKSLAEGVYLSYDIEYDEQLEKLIFRTYTGQRGTNRGSDSLSPLYLSHHTDFANIMGSGLNYASAEVDASDQVTFVYSGKQTEDTNNFFATLANESAIELSPFGREEDFITTGDSLTYEDVIAEARSWLQHKYKNMVLNAHIQQDSDIQFGLDYGFGDIVAFRYLGETLNIHLDEFKIIVDSSGNEDISVISTKMEKELLIDVPVFEDYDPIIKNERIEDEENLGVPLFYKHHSVAQSFALDENRETFDISYVDIQIRRVGLPQRDVSMFIYSGDSSKPVSKLSTQPTVVAYDFIPDGLYTWIRFALQTPVTITRGTTYWIVLTCGTPKSEYGNYYRVGVESEMRYQFGSLAVTLDGIIWTGDVSGPPDDGDDDNDEPEETAGTFDMIFAIGGV